VRLWEKEKDKVGQDSWQRGRDSNKADTRIQIYSVTATLLFSSAVCQRITLSLHALVTPRHFRKYTFQHSLSGPLS